MVTLAVEATNYVGTRVGFVICRHGTFMTDFGLPAEFRAMTKNKALVALPGFLFVGVDPGRKVVMVSKADGFWWIFASKG